MTLELSPEAYTDELLDRAAGQKDALDATPWWRLFRRWRLEGAWLRTVSRLEANERERVRG